MILALTSIIWRRFGPQANESLALTVARARRWQGLLESGRFASIRELAVDVGIDDSYLAGQLRFTLLAPGAIEAILDGTRVDGLSPEQPYWAPMA